jgi:hypothetical protein
VDEMRASAGHDWPQVAPASSSVALSVPIRATQNFWPPPCITRERSQGSPRVEADSVYRESWIATAARPGLAGTRGHPRSTRESASPRRTTCKWRQTRAASDPFINHETVRRCTRFVPGKPPFTVAKAEESPASEPKADAPDSNRGPLHYELSASTARILRFPCKCGVIPARRVRRGLWKSTALQRCVPTVFQSRPAGLGRPDASQPVAIFAGYFALEAALGAAVLRRRTVAAECGKCVLFPPHLRCGPKRAVTLSA